MHQYRQVLDRMRMSESNRAIANSGFMGRSKVRELKEIAQAHSAQTRTIMRNTLRKYW